MRRSQHRCIAMMFVVVVIGAVVVVALNGCSTWIAHAIVDAPNGQGGAIAQTAADELTSLGIAHQERIDVGPPAATVDVWILNPTGQPRATIFILHGLRDRKRTQVELGRKLANEGFRAVLVDLRGHGESTGKWLTYGVVESHDLLQLLNELSARHQWQEPVGVIGASYGGACAIQWAAIDDRVQAIVAIATFTSLRDAVPSYLSRAWIGWLVSDAELNEAFEYASELASFDPEQASPLMAIQKNSAPVLLIHGADDAHLSAEHSRRLHAAAAEKSRLVIIPDANHDTIMADRDGSIWREMLAWFAAHLK